MKGRDGCLHGVDDAVGVIIGVGDRVGVAVNGDIYPVLCIKIYHNLREGMSEIMGVDFGMRVGMVAGVDVWL